MIMVFAAARGELERPSTAAELDELLRRERVMMKKNL